MDLRGETSHLKKPVEKMEKCKQNFEVLPPSKDDFTLKLQQKFREREKSIFHENFTITAPRLGVCKTLKFKSRNNLNYSCASTLKKNHLHSLLIQRDSSNFGSLTKQGDKIIYQLLTTLVRRKFSDDRS